MSDVLLGSVGSSALDLSELVFTPLPTHRHGNTLTDPPTKEFNVSLSGGETLTIKLNDDPAWLYGVLGRFKSLFALPPNWDSYGAGPLQSDALIRGLLVLLGVMRHDSPTPSVVPTSAGGVQFEWHRSGFDLEIDVEPNEPATVWYHELATGGERSFELGTLDLAEDLGLLVESLGSRSPQV